MDEFAYYRFPERMPTHIPLFQTGAALLAAMAGIVWLTTRGKMPAFFALLIACFTVGLLVNMPSGTLLTSMQDGFGNIMKSLGFIIVLGTTLGVLLEESGATVVLAEAILRMTGRRYAAWAMSFTGLVVGMPIFCDSGFIVLSGVNGSVAARTGLPSAVTSTCLATGLYAVHCLLPPHPGVTAAVGLMGVDPGRQLWAGLLVAVPAMVAGHAWAVFSARRLRVSVSAPAGKPVAFSGLPAQMPPLWRAALPVVVPIALIAGKSLAGLEKAGGSAVAGLSLLGNPVPALLAGIVLAALPAGRKRSTPLPGLLQQALEKAGGILVIIGAGGAFGNVLATTRAGEQLGAVLPLGGMGLLFPFLLTALLKTAQGSSTVAIITAASLVRPLLPALGLAAGNGPLLGVLAMGAGSMLISHANDAYFWVISKFGGMDTETMLKVYSPASVGMGITALGIVYVMRWWLGV